MFLLHRRFSLGRIRAAGVLLGAALWTGFVTTACELAVPRDASRSSEEWSATYLEADVQGLVVKTRSGDITVTGSDRADLRVVATKRARGASPEASRGLLDRTVIKEGRHESQVTLEVEAPRGLGLLGHSHVEVDFAIEVPRLTAVDVQTVNGTIRADTLDGPLKVTTVNGRIDARRLGGSVAASAVNGRIAISLARIDEGGVQAKTVNGAVGITLPQESKATLAGSCVNCSVRSEGLPVDRTDQEADRGRRRSLQGTMNGGGPEVRVSTVNGSIRFVAGDTQTERLVERESNRQP